MSHNLLVFQFSYGAQSQLIYYWRVVRESSTVLDQTGYIPLSQQLQYLHYDGLYSGLSVAKAFVLVLALVLTLILIKQDSWYEPAIKTSIGIGLEMEYKSRHVFVLVTI